ncbi:MAG: hypothetical protein P8Y62_06535 [candidate division WOR-3 bacterium]
MCLLSLLLFSALTIDGENYVKIYRSSNEIDLFFFEQGFFTPIAGSGIIGADLNPAVLGKTSDVQFFTGLSLPGVSSSNVDSFSFEVDVEDETVTENVFVSDQGRLYGQYRSLGGFNFVGFSKRLGMFGVGVSYGAGYRVGVQSSLSGSIYGTFQSDEPFEFTHEDFSEIEEGEVISVNPKFSGGVSLVNPVPLRVEYSDFPIFVGGGYNYGPLSVGMGLKFQKCRLMGEGSFSAHIDSLSVTVDDTVVVDGDGDEWIIEDFSAELGNLDESFFEGVISSNGLSATNTIFTLGTLFDFPYIQLSLGFDFGGTYDLSGGYEWRFSTISELPEDFVSVDSTYLTIIDDSLITGTAIIRVDSMIRDEESEFDDAADFKFAGSSFNFGFILDFPLKIGFNGRLAFPYSEYNLHRLGLCMYTDIPVPVIDLDFGLAADCVFIGGTETDSLDWRLVPSASVGLTFSYERDYLGFYLPVKYDVSHIASTILNNVLEDEEDMDVNISSGSNIWANLAFGVGFRIKM